MTETLTRDSTDELSAVFTAAVAASTSSTVTTLPAGALAGVKVPDDWGRYDTQRPATAAEMAGDPRFTDKYGSVHATVIGRRSDWDAPWVWSEPLTYAEEIAHSIADGYGEDDR